MFWDLFAYLGTCQVSTTVCRLDFISKPFLVPILGCPLRSVRRTGISSLVTHHWSGHYDVIHVLLFGCGFFLDNCLRQHVEIQRPEDPTHFGEQSLQDISVSFSMCTAGIMVSKFASSMLTGFFAFFIVPVAFPFIGLAPSVKDVGHAAIWHCRLLQWTPKPVLPRYWTSLL